MQRWIMTNNIGKAGKQSPKMLDLSIDIVIMHGQEKMSKKIYSN